jgi:hypothetical protein
MLKEAKTEKSFRVFPLADGRYLTLGDRNLLQLWSAEGVPGKLLAGEVPRGFLRIISLSDGRFLTRGPPSEALQIWEEDGDLGPPIALKEGTFVLTAMPLANGKLLLSLGDGTIVIVNSDGSLREMPFPPGPDGRYHHHKIIKLSDGRLLVSTSGNGTRIWSADGEPGPQILDEAISEARLLSDGNFLVWPINRYDLQIVSADGQRGPVLREHQFNILNAFQLADGRILSWAEDSTIRLWPGSADQAVAWADDVIERLEPLTLAERCQHYLESPAACAEFEKE